MKTFKLSQKIILPIILLFTYCLYAVVINLPIFDETLDPRVSQLLKSSPMPDDKDNAYVALLGIKSDDSEDMFDAGIQILAEYHEQMRSGNPLSPEHPTFKEAADNNKADAFWLNVYVGCNDRVQGSCLHENSIKVKQLPKDSHRFELLTKRYQSILDLNTFKESNKVSFGMPVPGYRYMIDLGKIEITRRYNNQNYSAMLAQMQKDMRFWRMILKDSKSLLAKMVAVARIWGNLEYSAELLNIDTLTDQHKQIIENLAQPLTTEELDISESFNWEFLHAVHVQENLPASYNILGQFNASLNTQYRLNTEPLMCLSKLDYNKFKSFYSDWKKRVKQKLCGVQWSSDKSFLSKLNLYNLIGKSFSSESTVVHTTDYIARVHDLNGMIKMVHLKLEMSRNPDASLDELIRGTDLESNYSEYNFSKNEENKLEFECLSKGVGRGSICSL